MVNLSKFTPNKNILSEIVILRLHLSLLPNSVQIKTTQNFKNQMLVLVAKKTMSRF